MKNLHVQIDDKLYNELEKILPFHGGVSHGARIAIQNFVRDMKTGKIKISTSKISQSEPE